MKLCFLVEGRHRKVGAVFGLDFHGIDYGIDAGLVPDRPVIVDIDDFPSCRRVPVPVVPVPRMADAILDPARASSGSRTGSAVPEPRASGEGVLVATAGGSPA